MTQNTRLFALLYVTTVARFHKYVQNLVVFEKQDFFGKNFSFQNLEKVAKSL